MVTRLNPVSFPTGQQKHFEPEFALPGTLTLEITRIYMDAFDEPANPLGKHTLSSLDILIRDGEEENTYQLVGLAERPVHFERPEPQLFARSHNASHRHLSLEPLPRAGLRLHDRDTAMTFTRYENRIWRVVRIEDSHGNAVVLERDENGLIREVIHPDGLRLTFHNNPDGTRAGYDVVGLDGTTLPVMRYSFTPEGQLARAHNHWGESWSYQYDANGRRTQAQSDGGTLSVHLYDEAGRVVAVNPDGPYKSGRIEYGDGLVTLHYNGDEGHFEKLWFDKPGRHTATALPDGGISRRHFNEMHDEIGTTDANGNSTTFEYDAHGNLQIYRDGEGRETFTVYDDLGRVLSVTDPAGASFEYDYNDQGQLVGITSPLGETTNIVNAPTGQPTQIMRHDGLIEFRSYDEHNRLSAVVDFNSNETGFAYDAFNRPVSITDAAGAVTQLRYEEVPGRGFHVPSEIVRPDGATVRRSFTPAGDVESLTDGEGRITRYKYGPYRVLEEIIDPTGNRLKFHYDSQERLRRVTNQNGLSWDFERDPSGRVVRESDFDNRELRYTYDWGGRVTRRTNPDGSALEYTYDRADLLTELRAYEPGEETPSITRYTYDEAGRLIEAASPAAVITLQRDAMGQVIAETSNGRRIETDIDCCGRPTARRINGQRVDLRYDGMGGLTEWALEGHAPLKLKRNKLGLETFRQSAPGFTQLQEWDGVGQLVKQWAGIPGGMAGHPPSGEGAAQREYTWSAAHEPVAIRDALWGERRYSYDRNGQILHTSHGDSGVENFRYGADLNLSASGDHERFLSWEATPAGVVKLARGPRGEIVKLEHDACGRVISRRIERDGFRPQTWQFTWNAQDQMVSCVTPEGIEWRYAYDPFGRRISKECATSRSEFVWDGDVLALEVVDGVETEWFFEPDSFRPLAKRRGNTLTYIVNDHLGTPKEMVAESGQLIWAADHDTWGTVRHVRGPIIKGKLATKSEANPQDCPIRFQGQWEDAETGLFYNRFRYYEPGVGSFTSLDPIRLLGGVRISGYVSIPTTQFDRFGLVVEEYYKMVGETLCIGTDTLSGAAANEMREIGAKWKNAITRRGGRMTAGPLTSLQRKAQKNWRQRFRNKYKCCFAGNDKVAGHIPDAAAGGMPNPALEEGMVQMRETNSFMSSITADLSRKRTSYTWVKIADNLNDC